MSKKRRSKTEEAGLCDLCEMNTWRVHLKGKGGCSDLNLCSWCYGESCSFDKSETDKVPPDQ